MHIYKDTSVKKMKESKNYHTVALVSLPDTHETELQV